MNQIFDLSELLYSTLSKYMYIYKVNSSCTILYETRYKQLSFNNIFNNLMTNFGSS